jgi:hypothetical protein
VQDGRDLRKLVDDGPDLGLGHAWAGCRLAGAELTTGFLGFGFGDPGGYGDRAGAGVERGAVLD